LVFLSYIVIGFTGYFGFSSVDFKDFVKTASVENRPIAQNCIQMFSRTNIPAFFLRIVVFNLVFASFPILNFFFRAGILKIYLENSGHEKPKDGEYIVEAKLYNTLTVMILLIPLSVSVFYPQIAKILGYVGAVAGIFVLYALPIATYLVKLKNEADNPIISIASEMARTRKTKKLYQVSEESTSKKNVNLNESSCSSTKHNNKMFEYGLKSN
jgi:amino acid permease